MIWKSCASLAAFLLFLTGCNQSVGTPSTETTTASISAQEVELRADDGERVFGTARVFPRARGTILLFHQAGSSAEEYATIAPLLAHNGWNTLAIDQRVGGSLFGDNRTAADVKRQPTCEDVLLDMEAALTWAKDKPGPTVVWGSSYSAALVFLLAARHPKEIDGVVAFSPGEYLSDKSAVKAAAARVRVPVLVAAATDRAEFAAARGISNKLNDPRSVLYLPPASIHGSSTLIADRNREGWRRHWKAVDAFLENLPDRRANIAKAKAAKA